MCKHGLAHALMPHGPSRGAANEHRDKTHWFHDLFDILGMPACSQAVAQERLPHLEEAVPCSKSCLVLVEVNRAQGLGPAVGAAGMRAEAMARNVFGREWVSSVLENT